MEIFQKTFFGGSAEVQNLKMEICTKKDHEPSGDWSYPSRGSQIFSPSPRYPGLHSQAAVRVLVYNTQLAYGWHRSPSTIQVPVTIKSYESSHGRLFFFYHTARYLNIINLNWEKTPLKTAGNFSFSVICDFSWKATSEWTDVREQILIFSLIAGVVDMWRS